MEGRSRSLAKLRFKILSSKESRCRRNGYESPGPLSCLRAIRSTQYLYIDRQTDLSRVRPRVLPFQQPRCCKVKNGRPHPLLTLWCERGSRSKSLFRYLVLSSE